MYILVKLSNFTSYFYTVKFCSASDFKTEEKKIRNYVLDNANADADIKISTSEGDEKQYKNVADLISAKKVATVDRQMTLDQLCDSSWNY